MAEERHTTSIDIQVDDRQVVALGEEIERAFSSKVIDQFNSGLERQTKALQELLKEHKKLSDSTRGRDAGGGGGRGGGGRGGRGGGDDRGDRVGGGKGIWKEVTAGVVIGNMITGALRRMTSAVGGAFTGSGVTESALAAVPGGGVLAAAAGSAKGYYSEFAQRRIAQANIYGRTRLSIGGSNRAVHAALGAGMMGDEGIQGAAQAGEETGMVGDRLANMLAPGVGTGGVGGLFQFSQFGGVKGLGQAIGAQGTAGPEMDPKAAHKLMFDAVGTGLAAGFRESRLDRLIMPMAQFVEDSRTRGIRVDNETVLALTSGIAASVNSLGADTRTRGAALGNFATGMLRAGQGVGDKEGLWDYLSLRALGVTGEKGGKGIFEAKLFSETPEGALQMATGVIDAFRPGNIAGGTKDQDPLMNAQMFQWEANKAGVPMSFTMAAEMMRGNIPMAEMTDLFRGQEAKGEAWLTKRVAGGKEASQIKRKEAEFNEKRVMVGEQFTEFVGALRKTDISSAVKLLPVATKAVEEIAEFMQHSIDLINNALGKKWEDYKKGAAKEGTRLWELLNPNFDVLFGEPGKSGAMHPDMDRHYWQNPDRKQKTPGHFNKSAEEKFKLPGTVPLQRESPYGDDPGQKATSAAEQLRGAAADLEALAMQLGETSDSDMDFG